MFKQRTSTVLHNYLSSVLTNAYRHVKENVCSVRNAAFIHGVSEATLRYRILKNIDPEYVTVGKKTMLVNHFNKMTELGYGYSRRMCFEVASNHDFQLLASESIQTTDY